MGKRTLPPSSLPDSFSALTLEHVESDVPSILFQLATNEEVAAGGLHVVSFGSATVVAASRIDVPAFNRVVGLGIGEPASEALLDEIIDGYAATGVPRFFVKVSPATGPPALFEWLHVRGFVHHDNGVKLFRGAEDPPPVPTDLQLEVVGPEQAATFAAITVPTFGWPPLVQTMMARLVGQPGWRHYVAFAGCTPVAAAGLYVSDTYGYLGQAATLPSYRGRGAQRALLARRIRDAARLGCTVLVTETAEERPGRGSPSFRNVQRFGFEVAYLCPNYLLHLPPPRHMKVT